MPTARRIHLMRVNRLFKYHQVPRKESLRVIKAEGPDGQENDMAQGQPARNIQLEVVLSNKMW